MRGSNIWIWIGVIAFVIFAVFVVAMNKKKQGAVASLPAPEPPITAGCAQVRLAKPPDGKKYVCKDDSWQLVNI